MKTGVESGGGVSTVRLVGFALESSDVQSLGSLYPPFTTRTAVLRDCFTRISADELPHLIADQSATPDGKESRLQRLVRVSFLWGTDDADRMAELAKLGGFRSRSQLARAAIRLALSRRSGA